MKILKLLKLSDLPLTKRKRVIVIRSPIQTQDEFEIFSENFGRNLDPLF